ncbi:MAG: hypothetical protein A2W33_09230, partial [Chloroflexi bacterium RBG_16_52_11]
MKNRNILLLTGLLVLALAIGTKAALAQPAPAPEAQASTFHPTFALLDANGENVLTSGAPVSTMKTCGECHDTEFISEHAFHSELGLSDYALASESWNASTGPFGQWNPLIYRYLSQ